MIELWIFRHGQTEDNIKRVIQGHHPGKLTDLGQRQAIATGKRLKNEVFDQFFVSDLGRTKHTFELMQQQMPHVKNDQVKYTNLIREKNGGVLEGQPIALFKQLAQEQNIPFRQYKPQGGECWNEVNARANIFFQFLVDTYLRDYNKAQQSIIEGCDKPKGEQQSTNQNKKAKVLMVSHGGYITEFFNVINYQIDGREPTAVNSSINCALHVIQLQCSKTKAKCTKECTDYSCIIPKIILTNDNSHVMGLL